MVSRCLSRGEIKYIIRYYIKCKYFWLYLKIEVVIFIVLSVMLVLKKNGNFAHRPVVKL